MATPDHLTEPTSAPGDPDLDAAVFRAMYAPLRRYAAVVGSLSDDPDDLVQEAITRTLATTSLSDLDNPTAYLRRTISNLAINNTRSDTARHARDHLVLGPAASDDHYPSDIAVLDLLSPGERAAVFLADVEGRPFAEIAEILSCSPVAARLRASRGRRRLRQALEGNT